MTLRLDVPREQALDRAAEIVAEAWRSFDQARPTEPPIDDPLRLLLAAALPESPTGALEVLADARRALDEATARSRARRMFGRTLADFQLTQVKLGEMAMGIDASSLMIYRAAWTKDVLGQRVTREASMAKLFATETAQQVIDGAVQLFGGLGVVRGVTVERLYREVRALRIYEGASEVLKQIIGGQVLMAAAAADKPER